MRPILAVAILGFCVGIARADTAPAPTPTPVQTEESEPEIVVAVSPTRHAEPVAASNSAVTVITHQQIEDKKAFDGTDVIALAPGVTIAQSGDTGQLASVFLRGAPAESTLVLIDGMRVNSPSAGAFDFGLLSAQNIDRIEVLRGPQSALYGADASGGVINIITRRGQGPFQTGGDLEFGNYHIDREEYTARGSLDQDALSFALTRLHSGGYFTNDDARNLTASLRYDHPLSAHSNLAFTGLAQDSNLGVPGQVQFFFDPNEREQPTELQGSLQFTNTAGNRQDHLSFGAYNKVLLDDNPLNPGVPLALNSQSNSRTEDSVYALDGQSVWTGRYNTATLGFEARREHTNSNSQFPVPAPAAIINYDKGTSTEAVFAQDEIQRGRISLAPGVRAETNSQFGSAVTGKLAASYALNAVSKLKGSIGTGFNAPTFDELYGGFPGFVLPNPNLLPEKSVGYDFGYSHTLPRQGQVEAMFFHNRFRDLIADATLPSFVLIPENINRATMEGIEIGYNQHLGDNWKLIVNQTFMTTSANSAPFVLVRRPRFNTSGDAVYHRGRFNCDFGVIAQGHREDLDPSTFADTSFGGFTRLDLTLSYEVGHDRQVYIRARNLGNVHYQEVAGYPAMGLNCVVGYQVGGF